MTDAELMRQMAEALRATLEFIRSEYELPIMEGHHDGHPISRDARLVWDKGWNVLAAYDAHIREQAAAEAEATRHMMEEFDGE